MKSLFVVTAVAAATLTFALRLHAQASPSQSKPSEPAVQREDHKAEDSGEQVAIKDAQVLDGFINHVLSQMTLDQKLSYIGGTGFFDVKPIPVGVKRRFQSSDCAG